MEQYEQQIINAKCAGDIVEILDEFEIDMEQITYPLSFGYIHLLGYLAQWDLKNGIYLFNRHHDNFNNDVQCLMVIKMMRAGITNDFKELHKLNKHFQGLISGQSEVIRKLGKELNEKIQQVSEQYLENNFSNINESRYKEISNKISEQEGFIEIEQKKRDVNETLDVKKISRLAEMMHQNL